MNIEKLIIQANTKQASDLHLEAGFPAAIRVLGKLEVLGEPLPAKELLQAAQEIIGPHHWPLFLERCSYDLSKTLGGVRCRLNIFKTYRGVGLAIRLLSSFQATVERLNLHPDLKQLIDHNYGLILVSGPTGSGKSSTMAALIQEINLSRDCHIVTIENPIEYTFRPKQAFIRQREVGRDTPSFEQALQDAMREDPDVLMVGEIRSPETMRLILNASETGHLVLTTMHSATVADAINRLILSFPSEIQSFVSSQLADVLIAVISQRLVFRKDLNLRVPECEILVSNSAVKSMLRKGEIFKLATALETGREDGMWTFERYRNWLASKNNWSFPKLAPADVAGSDLERPMPDAADLLPLRPRSSSATDSKILRQAPRVDDDEVLEIADENIELEELITQLKGNGDSEE